VYATDAEPFPGFVNDKVYVTVSPAVNDEPDTGSDDFTTTTLPVGTVTGDGGELIGVGVPPPGGAGGVPVAIAESSTDPAVTSAAVTR
jgi:hypothetical protein